MKGHASDSAEVPAGLSSRKCSSI